MGNHYIPQFYLKGFTDCEEKIWFYERDKESPIRTIPKSIANETKFYSEEVEKFLTEEIEEPANKVLAKIRNREAISNVDKTDLAKYMIILHKRVPSGKARMYKKLPKTFEKTLAEYHRVLDEWEIEEPHKRLIISKRRNELQKLQNEKQRLFSNTWLSLLHPRYSPQTIQAINRMTWLFLETPKDTIFITSDNPFFFFTGLGVGNPKSEFSFPISNNLVLYGSWQKNVQSQYIPVSIKFVNEFNSRTASSAFKYVFAAKNASWICEKLKRKTVHLNRIDWKS